MYCSNCGSQIPDDAAFCPECGQSTAPATYSPALSNSEKAMPMKWHKFQCYFAMWLNFLAYLSFAILMFLGINAGDPELEASFAEVPGLKSTFMFIVLITAAIAVLAAVTAIRMMRYKKNASLLFRIYFSVSGVLSVVFSTLSKIGTDALNARTEAEMVQQAGIDAIAGLIVLAGMIFVIHLNKVYYKKREHLFVN